jgi:hypothetical protein
MMVLGRGLANPCTRSPPPAAAIVVSSASATARTRGSRSTTRFGVKARETNLRNDVWLGGSM